MAEEQIKALRIKRGATKRALTAYENFLNHFNPEEDFPALEKRYKEIEKTRESFVSYQDDLELLEAESDELHAHRTEFEDRYFKAYSTATKLLSKTINTRPQSPAPAALNNELPRDTVVPQDVTLVLTQSDNNNQVLELPEIITVNDLQTTVATSQTNHSNAAPQNFIVANKQLLPDITLPTFDGSFDSWLGFYDLFSSLIHEDTSISAIRKLFYLKGCLTGEAANVIASIESSSQNYEVAWNLLKERYDDRKVIREGYIQALFDTPSISKEFSTRSFVDHVLKNLRALKTLGEPIESWNAIIVVMLRNKLYNKLKERWEDHSSSIPNPTIDQMITFLTKRAHVESLRSQAFAKQSSSKSKTSGPPRQAFATSVFQARCVHCSSDDHYINNCSKFLELRPFSRYELAKRNGWCTNCLRKSHHSRQCISKSKCRTCDSRHNTLLHFDRSQNSSVEQDPPPSSSRSSAKIQSMHALVSSEALLATALVDIVNAQGVSRPCRVFLDAGSQAHFITEATARFLKLDRTSVNIAVNGVDDLCTNITHSARATIQSRFSKFSKNVEFLIIPQISRAMPSMAIDLAHLEIPKNIVLADPEFFKPSAVDALIGVDLFYKLLSIGQISLKNQPDAVLQKTQLG